MPFRDYAIVSFMLVVLFTSVTTALAKQNSSSEQALVSKALSLFDESAKKRNEAIDWFAKRGNKDAIAPLIQAMRFVQTDQDALNEALQKLSNANPGNSWHNWMLWQQGQSGLKPIKGFDRFKAELMARIDPNFRVFLYPGVAHDIRLEEIAWGGVRKDGIPALTNPKLIAANKAKYLTDEELVFGVEINGDARAYPLRIMDWHEMFNDVIGGVPVSLAYCTLCGSGILYETKIEGRKKPIIFGSSGFLYRSNKLMYDQTTNSLWNQFQGKPVVGKLNGSGIELKTRPVVITTWQNWRKANPTTKVLALETGFNRDYRPGRPYGQYFASPNLMFPAQVDQTNLKAKEFVFALRGTATEKAWPLNRFKTEPVINDNAGIIELTLVGNAETRTVRAYRTKGEKFKKGNNEGELLLGNQTWQVKEEALIGPNNKKLYRLPGHIGFWFAWGGNFAKTGNLAN